MELIFEAAYCEASLIKQKVMGAKSDGFPMVPLLLEKTKYEKNPILGKWEIYKPERDSSNFEQALFEQAFSINFSKIQSLEFREKSLIVNGTTRKRVEYEREKNKIIVWAGDVGETYEVGGIFLRYFFSNPGSKKTSVLLFKRVAS